MTSPDHPTQHPTTVRPQLRPDFVPKGPPGNAESTSSPVPISSIGDEVAQPARPRPTTSSLNTLNHLADAITGVAQIYQARGWQLRDHDATEARLTTLATHLLQTLLADPHSAYISSGRLALELTEPDPDEPTLAPQVVIYLELGTIDLDELSR